MRQVAGADEWGALLDAIERAIRSALDKGDARDRTFRERVYRQAFAALERALQANPSLTVETAIRRRKALQARITEIEAEYLPPAPRPAIDETVVETDLDVEPTPRAPEPRPGQQRARHADDIPAPDRVVVEARGPTPRVPDIMVETDPEIAPPADPSIVYGEVRKPRRRRRPIVGMFIALTLICVAALLGYGAYQMGLLGGNAARDAANEAARTPAEPETEDFEPGAEGPPAAASQPDAQRDWISVFAASDPSTVSAPGDAKAEAMQDSAGPFMRLTSGVSGSAILFDVGQGVLKQIAGKNATFNIVARSVDGKDTEISVACNFGELGDCGRWRYAVGGARADYLFNIEVPATEPGAGGTIAINSDFGNAGKSVDIFDIRVSVDGPATPAAPAN